MTTLCWTLRNVRQQWRMPSRCLNTEGELGEDRSFYFRGPHGRLHLRAQNLVLLLQIGDGVDDETWEYHLRCGDYSRWVRESIKDEDLAADVRTIDCRLVVSSAAEARD